MKMLNRKRVGVAVAAALFGVVGSAQASDAALLDVLLKNGVITQGQYNKLKAEYEQKKQSKAKMTLTKGGLRAKTADGNFSFKLGGRIHADAASINDDRTELDPGSGTEFRRVRLTGSGTIFHDWGYKVQVDYADDSLSLKDVYLQYKPYGVTIGQFKQYMGLEQLTSSNSITFMERAMSSNAFAPSHRMGVGIRRPFGSGTIAASIYGQEAGDGDEQEEGIGFGARATFAPINNKKSLVHLGVSAAREEPADSDNRVRFRERPEAHITQRVVNTGQISDVDDITRYGLEAAGRFGPFSVQGEYLKVDVARDAGMPDVDFDGGYVYASYVLTGESRGYKAKKGVMGGIKPKGRMGAWELALRYSTIDLNDSTFVTGGEADNWTLGLNWYVNKNVRFMANYIDTDLDSNASPADEDPSIFQVRAQVNF